MHIKDLFEAIKEKDGSNPLTNLLVEAARDKEIRKAFCEDPVHLIEERLGTTFPQPLNIIVHENDPNTVHITLPLDVNSVELSDTQLKNIAGGVSVLDLLQAEVQLVAAGVIPAFNGGLPKPVDNTQTMMGTILHGHNPQTMAIGGILFGIAMSFIPI